MWYRWRSLALASGLALWATLPLTAQQPRSGDRASGLAVDTAAVRPAPAPRTALPLIAPAAQEPAGLAPTPADTPVTAATRDSTALYLGLERLGPLFTFTPAPPPGHNALWLRPRLEDWTAAWAATARANAQRRVPRLAYERGRVVEKAAPEDSACCRFLPPLKKDTTRVRSNLLPGAVADYADIGMRIRGRGELGGAWNKYFPCDPSTPVQCKPTLFPQLKPDVQFGVQVGGTISDRVHVNVDYDQRREFDAANNINVYYEGKENEILQRVEVGDVSIRLPTSRYLTTGIPAGNFGFKATGQLGPLDFQTVFAQQRGDVSKREFRLNGGAGRSAGLVQDASVTLDDVDYVKGQFFWLVNPDSLPGAPNLNPLQMRLTDAPGPRRPAPGTLVLYRDERISPTSQQQIGQLGYFIADASIPGSPQAHSGYFHRLVAGEDYIVHSSGLWIVLKVPLRADEALAMGYMTATGETIGSIDADTARSTRPVLRLLRAPTSLHQPGFPDWPFEMHSVYRVDASNGVDAATLALQVSLGQLSGGKTFVTVGGKQVTFLKLFGLDEQTPTEQLDVSQIYQPANSGGAPTGKVGGTFVFLPTLKPFEAPPPVPSVGLSAAEAAAALGSDANADIYEKQDPVAREAAARFRLNFTYKVKLDGMVSTLSLGALGIREGSEKVFVGQQLLEGGKDYTIDYDIGQVTLLNPQSVFGGNPDAEIRATWEQKATFQIASTSIFGLNTRYRLGTRGELNFIGLYQKQGNIMARPELGTEPASIFLGGASGRLDLGGAALDRLLSWVPGLHGSGRSAVSLAGEAALSSPNPNTRGAAYVDDFEGGDEVAISFSRQSWKLGSNPERADGATVLPDTRDVANAMGLVWQDTYLVDGVIVGPMSLLRIDSAAAVTDRSRNLTSEPVMYITMGGDSVPGHEVAKRRWRSITSVLSTTGRDMSRSEYIEFYAKPPQGDASAALVLDLGRVTEDAFYYDAAGRLNGSYPDGTRWGLGEDDYEANPANHEIWGTTLDDKGLWNQPCKGDRVSPSFPIADPRANCTRTNGLVDSEDLNGDGLIDKNDLAYFRYVVTLDSNSPYLIRDAASTRTGFRLYRVPLRGIHTASWGTTDATWHSIQDLRITVVDSVGAARKTLEIARMRIVGSRWAKRDLAGLESGMLGTDAVASDTAAFQVGPVSSMTSPEYASPPGVTNELQDPASAFNSLTTLLTNERSLRLAAASLPANTRAEVYYRYPQQPRSFLNYRQMRIWALGRKGTWGASGNQRLLIKVGSDPRNYYVYQTRLNATHAGRASQQDWLPELAIDFNQWFALRAEAERALIAAPAGTQSLALWSRDSTYGIVLEDRARAPNLAAVRELSFAIYNGGLGSQPTEVWLDDIRLSGAMTDPGFAGNLTMDVRAGDFLALQGGIASQGPLYRQLGQNANYLRSTDASLTGTAQLGMLTPAAWDLDAPLTFSWGKTAYAPQFLSGTDLPADELTDLRSSGANRMRLGLTLRRRSPMANPWLGLLVDGVSLRFGYTGSRDGTTTSLAQSSGLDGAFMYDRRPSAREFGIIPGVLENVLKALFPQRIEGSEFFRRLTSARLRWTPEALSFSTAFFDQRSDSYRYNQILRLGTDTLGPSQSFRRGLDNDARLTIHPLESLTASVALSSTRDLLPSTRASDQLRVRQAIDGARGGLAGLDLGWEANRGLSTQLDWRPLIAAWLRPGFSYSARFHSDRNASYVLVVPAEIDSTASLLRQFQADRQITRSLQIDPKGFTESLLGPKKGSKLLRGLAGAFQPVELTWTSALGSQFDRVPAAAGAGYQLGLGALDAWRFIAGDTASTANTRSGLRARTGMTLPFGTELTATYDGTTTRLLDVAGGQRSDESKTWPGLQLSWPRVPLPRLLASFLTQAGLSAGYQHTMRTNAYGATAFTDGARTPSTSSFLGRGAGEETSIPLQFSLGLLKTVTATYNGSFTTGTARDATGDMRKDGSNHTVSLSGFFKMPPSMRTKFQNPVQATVGLSQQGDHQCRVGADAGCTPYIDYLTRRLNLSFDTQLDDLTLGFQMSYNSRKSNIGTLNGSSQFQLGLYGQFNISAGQLPGGER